MVEKYKTTLSEEAQKLAKEELREDDNARDQALEQMREWVLRNPRIIEARTDPSFLLRFLRSKKFSVPMAQEAMERYMLLRQTWAQAFNNLDLRLPNMDFLLGAGYLFAAPGRDKLGRRWLIARPGVFDPYKFTNEDMCRIHGIVYETMMEDEENQVRGYVHFSDGAGVSFPHLTLFTPKEAVRIVKNGERTLPMRHKEVYAINVPQSLKYVLDWGMTLISEKIKKRVKIFTSPEEALKEIDPSFHHMLPKEYGGEIPMAEMIDKFKGELEAHRNRLLDNDKMKMRLEMFTDGAKMGSVAALRGKCSSYADGNNSCTEVLAGSFRKLEVD